MIRVVREAVHIYQQLQPWTDIEESILKHRTVPFTIQRFCELVLDPTKTYTSAEKCKHALSMLMQSGPPPMSMSVYLEKDAYDACIASLEEAKREMEQKCSEKEAAIAMIKAEALLQAAQESQ